MFIIIIKRLFSKFSSLTKRDGQFLVGDCKYKNNFSVNDLIGKRYLQVEVVECLQWYLCMHFIRIILIKIKLK